MTPAYSKKNQRPIIGFGLGLFLVVNFLIAGILITPNQNTTNISPLENPNVDDLEQVSSGGYSDPFSPSSSLTSDDFLTEAERIAVSLAANATVAGGGWKWAIQGQNLTSLGDGAAGIGMYFLQLYARTQNSTYLGWAENVSRWLNSTNVRTSPGNFTMTDDPDDNRVYNGYNTGLAGIGDFYLELFEATSNLTYLEVAEDVYATLNSTQVYDTANGLSKFPLTQSANPTGILESRPTNAIYYAGSESSGSLTNLETSNDVDYVVASESKSPSIINTYDAGYPGEITLGSQNHPSSTAKRYSYQTFFTKDYPLDLSASGLTIRMRKSASIVQSRVYAAIYEWDNGLGVMVGGISDAVDPGTSYSDVSFTWSSNAPYIDGSSEHGYALLVEASNINNELDSATYYLSINQNNTYVDGRFYYSSTGSLANMVSYTNRRDLVFSMTGASLNIAAVKFEVKLSDLGLIDLGFASTFDDFVSSLSVQVEASQSVGAGFDYTNIFLVNKRDASLERNSTWEEYTSATITGTDQTFTKTVLAGISDYLPQFINASSTFQIVLLLADAGSSFTLDLDYIRLSLQFDDRIFSYNLHEGNAGIGKFLLNLYRLTGNASYLENAYNITRFLDYESLGSAPTSAYWSEKIFSSTADSVFSEARYTGYYYGAVGIGDFLLNYAEYDSNNSVSINLIKGIASWLQSTPPQYKVAMNLITGYQDLGMAYPKSVGDVDIFSGYGVGAAGILDFYLKAADFFGDPTYLTYANRSAVFLTSTTWEFDDSVFQYGDTTTLLSYKVYEKLGGTQAYLDFSRGAAGVLYSLNQLVYRSVDPHFSRASIGLASWMISESTWSKVETGNLALGLKTGLAGIGMALLGVETPAKNYYELSHQKVEENYDSLNLGSQDGEYKTFSSTVGAVYSPGYYYGSAGIGLSFINHYMRCMDDAYLDDAKAIGDKLVQKKYWNASSVEDNIYCGIEKGVAGIGMFLVELSRVTHESPDTYADGAETIALYLADKAIETGISWAWPEYYTYDGGSYSTDQWNTYLKGTAGIVDFFIEMWKLTGNSTYLDWAQKGGNHLIFEAATQDGYNVSWVEKSGGSYHTGFEMGTAGIGSILLKLGLCSNRNTTFLSYAERAGWYLYTRYETGLYNRMWPIYGDGTGGSSLNFASGTAGILDFILDLYLETRNSTFETLIDSAKVELFSGGQFVQTTSSGIRWQQTSTINSYNYGYSLGSAGIIDFLLRLAEMGDSSALNAALQGAAFLINVYPGSGLFPQNSDGNPLYYTGFSQGTTGITDVLFKICDFEKPSVSVMAYSEVLANMEYDDALLVTFTASDAKSGLECVNLTYTVQQPGQSSPTRYIASLPISGTSYSFTFPYYQYNTEVKFFLVVADGMGHVHLDDNSSNWYTFRILDLQAPTILDPNITDSRGLVRPLEYSDSGTVRVKVIEPALASQIKYVNLTYVSKFAGLTITVPMTIDYTTDLLKASVDTLNYKYGETFSYSIYTEDYAGNNQTITRSFTIADYTAPMPLAKPEIFTQNWAYAYSDVTIRATARDDPNGASLNPKGGIFMMVSFDGGVTWQEVTMVYDGSTLKYEGKIPGQSPWFPNFPFTGRRVRYVFGARDYANNTIYWGRDPSNTQAEYRIYETFEEIPIMGSYFYDVRINWITVFIVMGIIAGATIGIYFIYTRRGSYWDRMRRKAGSKATFISVKERITSFFYWIGEKLERVGTKLRGAGERFGGKWENIRDWWEESLSEPLRKAIVLSLRILSVGFIGFWLYLAYINAMTALGTVLFIAGVILFIPLLGPALLKGIWGSLKALGNGIKDFFMGVRGHHVAIWTIISLLFIALPIIQYITEPPYPLGVLFLIDLGFVMFISGFVVFIMKLIFSIAYK